MTVRSARSGRRGIRRGATAVEFAMSLPIFLIFLMASFEFGWFNVIRHTADNAAYEAARIAMVPGATSAEATAKVDELLNILGVRAATVNVAPKTITNDTDEVTVEISIPMSQNGLIIPRFTKNKTIIATATLKTERAD